MEEVIRLGSARSLAANSSVPAEIRARLAEHPDPLDVPAGALDEDEAQ
jgi:hypothetical protein